MGREDVDGFASLIKRVARRCRADGRAPNLSGVVASPLPPDHGAGAQQVIAEGDYQTVSPGSFGRSLGVTWGPAAWLRRCSRCAGCRPGIAGSRTCSHGVDLEVRKGLRTGRRWSGRNGAGQDHPP